MQKKEILKNVVKKYKAYYGSIIGTIEITGTKNRILSIDFVNKKSARNHKIHPYLKKCVKEIDRYFRGKLKKFSMKLHLQGTDFQKKVWKELLKIPYGKTASYKTIAEAIGNKKAVRAVGGANHNNKIGIVIPCHRVIGASGELVGYGGGLWRKRWLLNHEKQQK